MARKSFRRVLLLLTTVIGLVLALPSLAAAADLDIVITAADEELGAYTGTEPFDAAPGPGNDTGPYNNIVRTNDFISFSWAVSVENGPAPNTTITQTLPQGLVWEYLPGFCSTEVDVTPKSEIIDDGRTIICNLGDRSNMAANFNVRAFVKGDNPNGTVFNTTATVSSSDPTTDAKTSNNVSVTVSAAPRVNLSKQAALPLVQGVQRNGEWGQQITFPITLQIDAENGKGARGNELIVATDANPLTFKDVLGPGLDDLEFIGCGLGGFTGLPGGQGKGPASVSHSGSISCTPDANGDIDIRIPAPGGTEPDLTGEHRPINNSGGTPVPANRTYLAVYYVRFWIANDDIPATDGLKVADTFTNFDPVSISGTQNFPGTGEPIEDNSASVDVVRFVPTQGTISFAKYFTPINSNSSTAWTNNHHIYPGTVFRAHVSSTLGGQLPVNYNGVVYCEIFDNTTYHLTTEQLPAGVTTPAYTLSLSPGVTAVIEYGVSGTSGHDATTWTAMRQEDCNDDAVTQWAQNWEDLGVPLEQINRVRMKLTSASGQVDPHSSGNRLVLQLKARNTFLGTNDLIPTGQILANFARISQNFDNGSGTWGANNYNPETAGGGNWGDRVFLTRGEVRIAKDSDPAGKTAIVGGETVKFKLQPTVTGYELPDGVMHDVVVKDTISQYSDYVVGSGSPEPDSVTPNGNGTTTLTWNLGDLNINEPVPPITYEVKYKLAVPNGAQSVNTVVISSPDDASMESLRTDTHTVLTSRESGILTAKQTLTPWTEPGDEHVFQVEYANNAAITQNWMAVIDILPYNGDQHGSNFTGELRLKEVQAEAGEDIYYTSRNPSEIVIYPKDDSNDLAAGSTKWCLEADFGSAGCPTSRAEATAVMVRKNTPTEVGEGHIFKVVLETEGNRTGDVYYNKTGVGSSNTTLQTSSEVVVDKVVASSLGDYVWLDANKDGIQDQGEQPVDGVTVKLSGTDKHGHDVQLETKTANGGRYLFENLVSGDYEITFVAPDGYEFTLLRQGNDREVDSDADPTSGRTGPITIASPIPLQADQEDLTWDAGIYEKPVVQQPEEPQTPTDEKPKPKPNPQPKPRLTLAKRADKQVAMPGQRVAYRIEIRNTRRGSVARNVKICDRLPRMTSLVKAPGGTLVEGQVCWRFKSIAFTPASKPIVRRIVLRVDRDARGGAKLVNRVYGPGGVSATAAVRVKPRPGSGVSPAHGGGVTG